MTGTEKGIVISSTTLEQLDAMPEDIRNGILELGTLLARKRKDYGEENIRAFGSKGVVVRLYDKMSRLKNLVMSDTTPTFESIEDTFLDVAGYGILGLAEHRRERSR